MSLMNLAELANEWINLYCFFSCFFSLEVKLFGFSIIDCISRISDTFMMQFKGVMISWHKLAVSF